MEAAGIASWHEEGLTDLERLRGEPDLFAELERRLKELFQTRTAQEWEDLGAEAGTECTMCRTSEEWFSHPQALESKMVIELQDPTYGRMLQPGINARMSLTPGQIRDPAPVPDQHREEILSEVASQRSTKAPQPIKRNHAFPCWRESKCLTCASFSPDRPAAAPWPNTAPDVIKNR